MFLDSIDIQIASSSILCLQQNLVFSSDILVYPVFSTVMSISITQNDNIEFWAFGLLILIITRTYIKYLKNLVYFVVL